MEASVAREIPVVAAAIIRDGHVLCAQRRPGATLGGMWEFPGGKIEPGEAPADALAREIHEELSCVIRVDEHVVTTRYEYDFGVVVLSTYVCELLDGSPQASEHSSLMWLRPSELDGLEWAPADIPAAQALAQTIVGL
ncbi:(deoxy)nucleoside triphosphate pyrophosphohydrolase [Microbacterium sp. JZ70]